MRPQGAIGRRRGLRPLSLAAAFLVFMAMLSPGFARWITEADAAVGLRTGRVDLDVGGLLAFEFPACEEGVDTPTVEVAPSCLRQVASVDITNTGSLPVVIELSGLDVDACVISGWSIAFVVADGDPSEGELIRRGAFCELADTVPVGTLDPGSTVTLVAELSTQTAPEPGMAIATHVAVTAHQWNQEAGWSTVRTLPVSITSSPQAPIEIEEGDDAHRDDAHGDDQPEERRRGEGENPSEETPASDPTRGTGSEDERVGDPPDQEAEVDDRDASGGPSDEGIRVEQPTNGQESTPDPDEELRDAGNPGGAPSDPANDTSQEDAENAPGEPTEPRAVTGIVWFDDGDGIRIDPPSETPALGAVDSPEPEPRAADVMVDLLDRDGTVVTSTVTNEDGVYRFDAVTDPLHHVVRVVAPSGFGFATVESATGEPLDSDIHTVVDLPVDNDFQLAGLAEIAFDEFSGEATADVALVAIPPDHDVPIGEPSQGYEVDPVPSPVPPAVQAKAPTLTKGRTGRRHPDWEDPRGERHPRDGAEGRKANRESEGSIRTAARTSTGHTKRRWNVTGGGSTKRM